MGLWEEAESQQQRQAAAADEWARRQAERDARDVAAQRQAVSEFVSAMQRLGIPPRRHRFWSFRTYSRDYRSWTWITGWATNSPREKTKHPDLVVTPDGKVHSMRGASKKPMDLDKPVRWATDASEWNLVDCLRGGLADALRNK